MGGFSYKSKAELNRGKGKRFSYFIATNEKYQLNACNILQVNQWGHTAKRCGGHVISLCFMNLFSSA